MFRDNDVCEENYIVWLEYLNIFWGKKRHYILNYIDQY